MFKRVFGEYKAACRGCNDCNNHINSNLSDTIYNDNFKNHLILRVTNRCLNVSKRLRMR